MKKNTKKEKENRGNNSEIKGYNSNNNFKIQILNNFLNKEYIIPFTLKIDIKKDLKWYDCESDKFNFSVKFILENIFKNKKNEKIIIYIDERNIATSQKYQLEKYLKTQSIFCNYNNLFSLKYCNSDSNEGIQISDFFANYFWTKFNFPNTDKISKELKITSNNLVILDRPNNFNKNTIIHKSKKYIKKHSKITFFHNYKVIYVLENINNFNIDINKYERKDTKDHCHIYKYKKDSTLTHYFTKNKIMIQGSIFDIKNFIYKIECEEGEAMLNEILKE